ncbi:MAG: hypothetical protein ACRDAJ_06880 [Serratia fonticola]
MNIENRARFVACYTDAIQHLRDAGHRLYQIGDPAAWAEKMVKAFCEKRANKDGDACKRACKALGIKHTYQAIETYLGVQGEGKPKNAPA